MEQTVVKKEPEELVDISEGDISMNYDNQEIPSTSGITIKQEIKEELDNDEVLLDKGYIISLPQRYLNIPAHNFGSKINDSEENDNSVDEDESGDLSCNIKEEGMVIDFAKGDKNSLHNKEKDEDEAMFETKIKVEHHGVQYDESGSWNLKKPRSSQKLQEEAHKLSDDSGEDFSDFSDADPDCENDESEDSESNSSNEDVYIDEEDAAGSFNHNLKFNWHEYSGNHRTFTFVGKEGIQIDLEEKFTPLDAYQLFVSHELIALIVEETNRYAAHIISKNTVMRESRLKAWFPTNDEEIRKFMGLYIWMGLNSRPSLGSYWSTDVLYKNKVSELMSRNRFEILLRMIHFNDNENKTTDDGLCKLKPVLDMLNSSFQRVYAMGKEVVIDESMIPWRGRLYIPSKSHKYGVKIFKLCSNTGYTWKCQVYTGRQNTESVVMSLMEGLLDEGRVLYTDKFYTRCTLARTLLSRKTHLVGPLRRSRKHLPKEVTAKKLKKHEYVGQETNDGIVVSKWKDAREVLMLSTLHTMQMRVQKQKKSRTDKTPKLKPEAIIAYNKVKCGIDKSDQVASYSTCNRRGVKWYRKVVFELLTGMAMVNAFIVHKNHTHYRANINAFREDVARDLLYGKQISKRNTPKPEKVVHLLNKTNTRKQCSLCYNKLRKELPRAEARKKVKQVKTFCLGCDGKPMMCLNCHIEHHS